MDFYKLHYDSSTPGFKDIIIVPISIGRDDEGSLVQYHFQNVRGDWLFDLEYFGSVKDIEDDMRPYKKRDTTEEEKAKMVECLFSEKTRGRNWG